MHVLAERRAMGDDEVYGPTAIMRILPVRIARFIRRPTDAAERPSAGDVGIDYIGRVTAPVIYVGFDSV